MKMDFQRRLHGRRRHRQGSLVAPMYLAFMALAACAGPNTQTPPSNYTKTTDECAANAIPGQFIVHYIDGSMATVKAPSEAKFLTGFFRQNAKSIAYAEPDYRVHAAVVTEMTTALPAVTTADNWGVQRVEASALWQQEARGQNVTVAVVDSGMDLTHPQLAAQLAVNLGEMGPDGDGHDKASNNIDDDGNGFIDDSGAYDFTANQPRPLTEKTGNHGDYNIHGTHVAGIIAAQHADSSAGPQAYVEGLAPKARVLPLAFLDDSGQGTISDGVKAIQYALARGAKVINASWGGTVCSRSLRDVIAAMDKQGVTFVSASGNDASDIDAMKEYPASLNLAAQITIGATGLLDYKAEYSNYGAQSVHVFAPGTDIISTIPGGKMGALSGTSMATPFTSGAVALLLSAEPQATTNQIRQALYTSAIHRGDYINASQGRLNLRNALAELRRQMGK